MNTDLDVDELRRLVSEFVRDELTAAALSGSFARGDPGPFSDIDLRLYSVRPIEGVEADHLEHRHGRLLSVSLHTFAGEARQLQHPAAAVFAVLPIRQLRPLLDRDGALADLVRQATAFSWDAIAAEADAYAARVLYEQTEVVHKVQGGLAANDALRLALATAELVQELTLAVAVAHRVLVESDRSYFAAVYAAVGEASAWSGWHRTAIGFAEADTGVRVVERSMAALGLYRATADVLDGLLTGTQRSVIREAGVRIDGTVWGTRS